MNLFRRIHFDPIDPLGNGLADEIAAEQAEPEAIVLEEDGGESLAESWQRVIDDFNQDPEYVELMRSIDE